MAVNLMSAVDYFDVLKLQFSLTKIADIHSSLLCNSLKTNMLKEANPITQNLLQKPVLFVGYNLLVGYITLRLFDSLKKKNKTVGTIFLVAVNLFYSYISYKNYQNYHKYR